MRINPEVGISTAGVDADGRFIATFNQNQDTGTIRLWGHVPFQAQGQGNDDGSFFFNYQYNTYSSELSSATVVRGGNISATFGNRTDDAKTGLWTIQYDGSNWCLREPNQTSCLTTWAGGATLTNQAIGTPTQFELTFTDGGSPFAGDRVDFVVLGSPNDGPHQKKFLFGPTNPSYRNGMSGLSFHETAYFQTRGAPGFPVVFDRIGSEDPYYTIQSSAPMYIEHASFSNVSKEGIWISGDPNAIYIASTTLDFMGIAPGETGAYVTYASSLTASATTFYGLEFGLSRSTHNATAYNIRTLGTKPPALTLRKWSGLMGGATNHLNNDGGLSWAPFQPSSGTTTTTAVWESSITHVWSAAADPVNDPGAFYRVELSSAPDFSGDILSSTTAREVFDASVENLLANTTYYSRIFTIDVGTANPLALEERATKAKPVFPLAIESTFLSVQINTITANWAAMPATPLEESAEGYVLEASSTNFDGSPVYHSSSTVDIAVSTLTAGFGTSLLVNTTYTFRVGTLNHAGLTTYITLGSTATLAVIPAPGAPSITDTFLSSATVSYSPGANPTGTEFQVFTSTAEDFTGDITATGWDVATSTPIHGLLSNTTYYLRSRARNWNGVPGEHLFLGEAVTNANPPLTAVSTFTAVSKTSMTVAWDGNGNGPSTLYEVELSTEPGFDNLNEGNVKVSTRSPLPPTAEMPGLTSNTTYYLSVRTISHGGTPSSWLALGSTATLTATPTADLEPFGEVYATSATVRWGNGGNAVDVTTYSVVMSTGLGYPNSNEAAGPTPGALLTGLKANATYYLYVAALNHAGAASLYNQVGSTVTSLRAPATAVSTFTAVHYTSMTVAWDGNDNITGTFYQIVLSRRTRRARPRPRWPGSTPTDSSAIRPTTSTSARSRATGRRAPRRRSARPRRGPRRRCRPRRPSSA
jgi:hypothetical protein